MSTTEAVFPYQPYPQQEKLMAAISECIESSSIGCFESPTGTGKSMCSLYACMSWLIKEEQSIIDKYSKQNTEPVSKVEDPDDWLNDFAAAADPKTLKEEKRNEEFVDKFKSMRIRISKKTSMSHLSSLNRTTGQAKSSSYSSSNKSMVIGAGNNKIKDSGINTDKESQSSSSSSLSVIDTEGAIDEFAPDHYDSGGEGTLLPTNLLSSDSDNESENGRRYGKESATEGYESLFPKIFYCSRTHTQIAQFVSEIQKSTFRDLRCVTLGSRKNMCIHESLAGLSDSHVSQECTNMHKHGKTSATSATVGSGVGVATQSVSNKRQKTATSTNKYEKCPHHKSSQEKEFADIMLNQVSDIEDIVTKGKSFSTCPYYASRKSIKDAQIVCLPYNMLLSSEMRESLGIDVTNSVVLIDEAHNLIETINQIYSNEMAVRDVELSLEALSAYLSRFRVILNGKNLYYTNLLVSCLRSVLTTLKSLYKKQYTSTLTTATSTSDVSSSASSLPSSISGTNSTATNSSAKHTVNLEDKTEILTANDFLFQCGIDNVNFIKLARYVEKSNLLNKVAGFAFQLKRKEHIQHQQQQAMQSVESKTEINASASGAVEYDKFDNYYVQSIRRSLAFMKSLTYSNTDGKIVIKYSSTPMPPLSSPSSFTVGTVANNKTGTQSTAVNSSNNSNNNTSNINITVQFAMLNPSVHFRDIVNKTRSVLLLGGTLQPFPYLLSQLFPSVPAHRVRTFACDHIVPPSHVLAMAVSVGPTGKSIELTHSKRNSKEIMDEIYLSIFQIASRTPNGMVVFFTSYAYMKTITDLWTYTKDTKGESMMIKLKAIKEVFIEPRNANDSEKIWSAYKLQAQPTSHPNSKSSTNTTNNSNNSNNNTRNQNITSQKGAILFCVIGGKLSEGINFSDELARCVVVIGLPYPDSRDPILQMKLQYTDSIRPNTNASSELYEAMCMKAVNQSIGRAIRHINDYSSIILLDQRYTRPKILQLLPGWISRNITCCYQFSTVQDKLTTFFQGKE